jgi:hypothetical protein
LEVVAKEVGRVTVLSSRMEGDIGWRQGEYKPAAASFDRRHPEYIAKERPVGAGVLGKDDHLASRNHSTSPCPVVRGFVRIK